MGMYALLSLQAAVVACCACQLVPASVLVVVLAALLLLLVVVVVVMMLMMLVVMMCNAACATIVFEDMLPQDSGALSTALVDHSWLHACLVRLAQQRHFHLQQRMREQRQSELLLLHT